ncbi:MAG TPA: acetyl-CoA carboxylase biotin carboxyl carrier protein [Bryobacteraceae bacterium]|nr:acetyl-CoA carboxylase biotin carboxyl carrier protein [Bryobacteraceae bacterium]
MNSEEMTDLRELIEFLKKNEIGEFDLEHRDLNVRIKFAYEGSQPGGQLDLAALGRLMAAQSPSPPSVLPAVHGAAAVVPAIPAATAAPAEPSEDAALHIITSPIVGTFYQSPSPGTPAFVKIGDTVETGQTVGIIEAMKLMNAIESDAAGEIVKRFVENGQPIEYGQSLFAVRAR